MTTDVTHPSSELSLRQLIREVGKTQAQIADELGVDPTYVSQMVNGKVNWRNSMYFPALVTALGLTFRQVQQIRPDAVSDLVSMAVRTGVDLAGNELRPSDRVQVAVHALASAGEGVWTDSSALEYVYVEPWVARRKNRQTFRVDGDSMQPTLSNSDYIHVDVTQVQLQDNKIYVVKLLDREGVAIKRARSHNGEWVLTSDNPVYPPVSSGEIRIVGRVFAVTPQTIEI